MTLTRTRVRSFGRRRRSTACATTITTRRSSSQAQLRRRHGRSHAAVRRLRRARRRADPALLATTRPPTATRSGTTTSRSSRACARRSSRAATRSTPTARRSPSRRADQPRAMQTAASSRRAPRCRRSTAAPTTWPEHDRLWGFAGDSVAHEARRVLVLRRRRRRERSGGPRPRRVSALRARAAQRMPALRSPRPARRRCCSTSTSTARSCRTSRGTTSSAGSSTAPASRRRSARRREARRAAAPGRRQLLASAGSCGPRRCTATRNGVTRTMTVEIRTWHGWEDGSADIRQHARWRYLEAFWHADVFAYTGHSHFGHGPLEPWEYSRRELPGSLPGDAGQLVPVVQLLRRGLPRDAPGRLARSSTSWSTACPRTGTAWARRPRRTSPASSAARSRGARC